MLSQRIVKSACLASLGIERDRNRAVLADSLQRFQKSILALQSGDPAIGLSPEQNPEILARLNGISTAWPDFFNIANISLSPAGLTPASLQDFDVRGLSMLAGMNDTVQLIARTYGSQIEELPLILSISIDLAGRQRMLTQKMVKEFCLIDAGVEVEANRENLAASLALFNNTLEGLFNGIPGILVEAPNYDIRKKLREVSELWQPMNTVLQAVASGTQITDYERGLMVDNVDEILSSMNEAVGMYEFVRSTR
ncbi:MAG: type IV pili methyl-accepting chemotaxis transducer N-terminal domain-containing protein [Rhodobacteraceae bacterium]|nr:type IV pili methyl-accepting chemotaxis transducer N-terminal domain-containing protein [Paracoccaceae bacterium]